MRAIVLFAAFACDTAIGANVTVGEFQMSGSGTLRTDQHTVSGGTLSLRATLQSKDAVLAKQSPVQEGSRFVLVASVTATASVCYNDTIFRDDYDDDGG
jgi:hypothetical protein